MLLLKRKLLTCFGLLFFLLLISHQTFSQTVTVIGTVVNATDDAPMAGVSVTEKGTNKGTITNQKGAFSLNVSGNKPVLLFNGVGFKPYTLSWDGSSTLVVRLEPIVSTLQDVVVVGYGTQKKINQTGATQTVKFDEAVNAPVTNSAQLMYGKFAGVQLTQASGLPGSDGSTIVIRGVGTFGGTDPLVVIDNIQYIGLDAFNNLSPSDIESVSVLKDASASSIYGARGANGVIVVTTKQGKSGVGSIIYNGYTGFQRATVLPEFLNAYDYATLKNEFYVNRKGAGTFRFTPAQLQAISDGSNPDQFANTNWVKEIIKDAPIQNHFLSFSGGNDRTTYRVSLGYLTQDAIVQGKFKTERFTLSANLNSRVNNWLTISNVLNTSWNNFKGPRDGPGAITAGDNGIIFQFQRSAPTVPAYYSSGKYGYIDGVYYTYSNGAIANALLNGSKGDYISNNINISNRFGVKVSVNKNLSLETSGSITFGSGLVSNYEPYVINYDYNGNSSLFAQPLLFNTLTNSSNLSYRLLNENILRYTKKIKKHDVTVLLGHSVNYYKFSGYSATASNFINDAIQQLSAAIGNPTNTGSTQEEALQSFFSRVNYSYNGRYLFEFNVRRDGSSKFGPNNTYGTFPSASAGWRVSQENFFKRKFNWISDMKLRASWGITGNDNIGNYIPYTSYSAASAYNIGGVVATGAAITSLANPRIIWEEVQQTDIGMDLSLLRNRLSITADYFIKNSSKVLYKKLPVPTSIGVSNLAAENAADMQNKGLELTISYQGKSKKLDYSIGVSGSAFNVNTVTGLGNRGLETITGQNIIRIGVPYNAYYGLKAIGIFQTAADIANAPVQYASTNTAPGDIKYADISGPDGKPDGIIDDKDLTVIGNPYPKLTYNFNGSLNYQGFDLNLVFYGLSGVDRLLMNNGQAPMNDDVTNVLASWVNRWTPTNPSSSYPRMGGVNNNKVSSYYIQDASFLRLKNLEFGYTIPAAKTKKFLVSKFRIYVSAQNLLTFTKMKNYDPERITTALTSVNSSNTSINTPSDQLAPLYKVYTVGLNLKF